MKKLFLIVAAVVMATADGDCKSPQTARQKPYELPRVIVSSDLGGTDPDDNQSVAHLLMYSNEIDLEGLVSSPSFGSGNAKEFHRMIDVYEKDLPQLRRHIRGLMTPEELHPLVKQGRQSEMPFCGYGEPTEGSDWIVKCARKPDPRPLYVLVWGCLEDVAQALHDAPDSVCVTLDIRKQKWNGYYKGNGIYVIRHSTYYTGALDYTITSTVKGFKPLKGQITVENSWNRQNATDYIVGPKWWTDSYAPADYWHDCAGANLQRIVRDEIMEDWGQRWNWLRR